MGGLIILAIVGVGIIGFLCGYYHGLSRTNRIISRDLREIQKKLNEQEFEKEQELADFRKA